MTLKGVAAALLFEDDNQLLGLYTLEKLAGLLISETN